MRHSVSTRRDFLTTTAGLASAVAVPYCFTSESRAAEAKNDRMKVASIGVGGQGTWDGRQAAELSDMVACCDVHQGNANRFADAMVKFRHPRPKIYADYRELLDKEKGLDAVVIATPDHWHVRIAIEAMKAGKHVYCEKPLTLTIGEGAIIQEAVRKYGKIFQVGTQQRSEYNHLFLKAVAIARSGRLGKNLRAVSSVGKALSRGDGAEGGYGPFQAEKPPAELDWDMWLGQAPAVPFCPQRIGWNFRWWFEYSGGQVTDWGVHHTDIAFWALAGKDGQAVEAEGTGKFLMVPREQVRDFLLGKVPAKDLPPSFNVAHEFDVNIRLSTGNTIRLTSGQNELLIEGENGRIRVNRGPKAEGQLTGKAVEDIDADPRAKQEIEQLMVEIYGGPLPTHRRGHFQNFFQCIRSGRQPVANVPDHIRAVNACHMANVALLLGRKVRWDLGKQQFLDDAEANGLCIRKQRDEHKVLL